MRLRSHSSLVWLFISMLSLVLGSEQARAANDITATFQSATDVPVTATTFDATGANATLSLNYAPAIGTNLMVVQNTGLSFITGRFANLAQGQTVTLSFEGTTYDFVANYYGGTGNDLVLVWKNNRVFAWGYNNNSQLGNGTTTASSLPVPVTGTGVLAGKTIISVASGQYHSIALCSDGTLAAWGSNFHGQLGDDSTITRSTPVLVNTTSGVSALHGKTVAAIAAGSNHSMALCSDGTVAVWGHNGYGQIGNSISGINRPVPTAVSTTSGESALFNKTVTAIAAGSFHSVALCSDGTVAAWGYNSLGQIGDNTSGNGTNRVVPTSVSTASGVSALYDRTVTAITAVFDSNFALCSDGTVAAWGNNSSYNLGDGTNTQRPAPVSINNSGVLAGRTVVAMSGGIYHGLALCSDGTLAAWGTNTYGQVGDNSTIARPTPVVVNEASGVSALYNKQVVAIAAGLFYSQALCSDGTVAAWGRNNIGQIGDGTIVASRQAPVAVLTTNLRAGETFAALHGVGESDHSLAIISGPLPPPVVTTGTATTITTTGATLNGTVNALGHDTAVSFEYGLTTAYGMNVEAVPSPLTGTGDTAVIAVLSGLQPGATYHYRIKGVNVATVGYGGDQTFSSSAGMVDATFSTATDVPVTTNNFTAAGYALNLSLNYAPTIGTTLTVVKNTGIDFIAGTFGNLAQGQIVTLSHEGILYDFVANYYGGTGNDLVLVWRYNRVFSWGSNTSGKLGNGTGTNSNVPLPVTATGVLAGKTVLSVATGGSHSLALCSDGTIAAWGANSSGQLGDNSNTSRTTPVAVDAGSASALYNKTVVAIAAGGSHSLALCSDGTVAAWGYGDNYQLGNSARTNSYKPILVSKTAGVSALHAKMVVAIAAGGDHSMALCSDGTLAAWGENQYGQIGDNTSGTDRTVPVAVNTTLGVSHLHGQTVTGIATAWDSSFALCADGSVTAWGHNSDGTLGNNTATHHPAPVAVSYSGVLLNRDVVALGGGGRHGLALCSDGSLASWGSNAFGQTGNNSTATYFIQPAKVSTASGTSALFNKTVVEIASGSQHNLVLCSDGTLVSWGNNEYGQLGEGTSTSLWRVPVAVNTSRLDPQEKFVTIKNGGNGGSHSLAVVGGGLPRPYVRTLSASYVTGNGATLSGVVGVYRASTAVSFDYGFTSAYGLNIESTSSPVATNVETPVNAKLTGLVPGTTYHFRVKGGSADTVRYGSDETFVTPAGTLAASFSAATDVPIAVPDIEASGSTLNLSLGYTPMPGTSLTVIDNTGAAPIDGTFTNLAQGQVVTLNYGGQSYNFMANYYGGTGNDLVLMWMFSTLNATFSAATDVPVTSLNVVTTGGTLNLFLNFAPAIGTNLTVVKSTGIDFIVGTFNNLAQGQTVTLNFEGRSYEFVANYYGGTGNDLVLVWKYSRIFAWGRNQWGQLGTGTSAASNIPQPITATGMLAGKTVVSVASSESHSLALCSDGTVAAWGENTNGELGDLTNTPRALPVAVYMGEDSALYGKTVVAIATGLHFSLALCSDGTVAAWGSNSNGQLGAFTVTSSYTSPVEVSMYSISALNGKKVVAISAGAHHGMALCSDGTVAAWGKGSKGEIGNGSANSYVVAKEVRTDEGTALHGKSVTAIMAGTQCSFALCSDGTVAVWGAYPQGSGISRLLPLDITSQGVLATRTVVGIAAGYDHTLFLCSDGTVAGSGENGYGQIGDNTSGTDRNVPVLVNTASGISALHNKTVVGIAASRQFSRALCSDGTVATWGNNLYGQLGDGTDMIRRAPTATVTTKLAAGESFQAISASGESEHSLSIVTGPAPPIVSTLAATSVTDSGATLHGTVNAGGNSTDVTFDYGYSAAYGMSAAGTPTPVTGLTDTAVNAALTGLNPGTTYHYRAKGVNGATAAYGSGQTFSTPLGTVSATFNSGNEVPLTTGNFTATGGTLNLSLNYAPAVGTNLTVVNNTGIPFIAGAFSNLAQGQTVTLSYEGRTYDFVANYFGGTGNDLVLVWKYNRAFAWGTNTYGQLGNGSMSSADNPLPQPVIATSVLGGKTAISLACGDAHSLALCSDGTVAAWGRNANGQLGDSSLIQRTTPVAVNAESGVSALHGKTVVAVAAGAYHSLALCSDGTVSSWGYNNFGQLGDNSTTNRNVPVAVNTISGVSALDGKTVVAIAAGGTHSMALCSDGTVVTWGSNSYGQLGENPSSPSRRLVPVAVNTASGVSALFGKTVTAIAAGTDSSFALCSDGRVTAWGYNSGYHLGDGTTTNRLVPVSVRHLGALANKTVVAIAAGVTHALALCSDGSLAAWGSNSTGQLGDNSTSTRSTPVVVNRDSGISALYDKTVVGIAAGSTYSQAICSDGTLATWGGGGGRGGSSTIKIVPEAVPATYLAAGERFVALHEESKSDLVLAIVGSPTPPLVNTVAAYSVSSHGATLNGLVNALAGSAVVSFDYGPTTDYGMNVTAAPSPVTGSIDTAVNAVVAGLQPTTTYHFRVKATTSIGEFYGEDMTFTTPMSAQQIWRQTYFGTWENTGNAADTATPQNDGISNLMKFALGMSPTVPGQLAFATNRSGNNFVFTYTRSKTAAQAGVGFAVKWSTTPNAPPANWSSVGVVESAPQDLGYDLEQITATVPAGSDDRLFVHLEVTGP